jgi:hypothetical protein
VNSCGLLLTMAFMFGGIGRQGGGFDACHVSRLASRFDGGCNRDALMGLPVGIFVGTLGIGDCSCMEHPICQLSLI